MNHKTHIFAACLTLIAHHGIPVRAATPMERGQAMVLEAIAIDINGDRQLASPGQTLEIVQGDLITLVDAWQKDREKPIDSLDLVGYAPRGRHNRKDDRKFVINTAVDLQPRFAVDKEQTLYPLKAMVANQVVGEIWLKVLPPRLDRVEISLNGATRTLQNGEYLTLKSSDKIVVRRVVTNVRGNENVRNEIRVGRNRDGSKQRELVFLRGEKTFGRIPIQWME